MEIVFREFRDRSLSFFGGLGGRFAGVLGLENRRENEGFFCDLTDPESGIWWGGSTTNLSPLKR